MTFLSGALLRPSPEKGGEQESVLRLVQNTEEETKKRPGDLVSSWWWVSGKRGRVRPCRSLQAVVGNLGFSVTALVKL